MSPSFATPLGRVVPRRSAAAVLAALADTRVVLINGARQSGKSTLVGLLARERAAEWRNLDSQVHRDAAIADPAGFVESDALMVIDEIQRAPTCCSRSRSRSTGTRGPAATW